MASDNYLFLDLFLCFTKLSYYLYLVGNVLKLIKMKNVCKKSADYNAMLQYLYILFQTVRKSRYINRYEPAQTEKCFKTHEHR